MAPKRPADQEQSRPVDDDDGFTLDPSEMDRIIEQHRRLTEAEDKLQRIIEEAAREVEAERRRKSPSSP